MNTMDRKVAEQILQQLINQAVKSGLFMNVQEVFATQQAYDVLKDPAPAPAVHNGLADKKELVQK